MHVVTIALRDQLSAKFVGMHGAQFYMIEKLCRTDSYNRKDLGNIKIWFRF